MSIAKAVIGSAYGDEGKGLMVDFLASYGIVPVVARTNGGSQVGHTVQTPDGLRHVFHHISSGALAVVPTHLTQFFVSHPMFFMREAVALIDMGANVSVSVDPRGQVTTPFDVAVNQVAEIARDGNRHGSCGIGFGETLERGLQDDFRLVVGDFEKGEDHLRAVLDAIRFEWVPERLDRLGVDRRKGIIPQMLASRGVIERFLDDCLAFWNFISLRGDGQLPGGTLFEGAQGLQLDQDYGAFPHVTRSHTGLRNMVAVAEEAGFETISATYMTRAYATRHGAGPFPYEEEDRSWLSMVDPTNERNPWQGAIRTAPVDLDGIRMAVAHDLTHADGRIDVDAFLGVSCVDQVAATFNVGFGREVLEVERTGIAEIFSEAADLPVSVLSYGPTRDDVVAAPSMGARHAYRATG